MSKDKGQSEDSRATQEDNREKRTLIGVLATHDDVEVNEQLIESFNELTEWRGHKTLRDNLKNSFQFVMTGGTFDRVVKGELPKKWKAEGIKPLNDTARRILLKHCGITRLPDRKHGGVTALSYLVVQQKCSIVWPFLSPQTTHWLKPENLALMRLCDHWRVKRLMNKGSVLGWLHDEAYMDANLNTQPCPPWIELSPLLRGGKYGTAGNVVKPSLIKSGKAQGCWEFKERPWEEEPCDDGQISGAPGNQNPERKHSGKKVDQTHPLTIALIAHDQMKDRMVEFAIDHQRELEQFDRILATGTTGGRVKDNAPRLENKIIPCNSGPKGGDIEIATEILFDRCQVVVFFIDPLNPHPHIEDIRVVFGACMIRPEVRMLTNEMQAREWMQRVVRDEEKFKKCKEWLLKRPGK